MEPLPRLDPMVNRTMFRFGSFKRSDRIELKKVIVGEGGHDVFVEALQAFIDRWENADWLEAYNVERVAKWCAIHLERRLIDRLVDTFETTRKVRTGGQDAYGVFLGELKSWIEPHSDDAGAEPRATL